MEPGRISLQEATGKRRSASARIFTGLENLVEQFFTRSSTVGDWPLATTSSQSMEDATLLIDRLEDEEAAAHRGPPTVVLDICSPLVSSRRSDPSSSASSQDQTCGNDEKVDLVHLNLPPAPLSASRRLARGSCSRCDGHHKEVLFGACHWLPVHNKAAPNSVREVGTDSFCAIRWRTEVRQGRVVPKQNGQVRNRQIGRRANRSCAAGAQSFRRARLSRSPGWSPFVNSTPAASNACLITVSVDRRGSPFPASNRRMVATPTPAASASCCWFQPIRPRAARHWADVSIAALCDPARQRRSIYLK